MSDQVRQSDVTFWAVAVLFVWAVALLGGVVSAFVPASMLQALHSSRLDNANIADLTRTVAQLNAASSRLREENASLSQRLLLREQSDTASMQRLAALEQKLTTSGGEATGSVDNSIITSSTGVSPLTTFGTKGGSVSYQTLPLPAGAPAAEAQPLPVPLSQATSDPSAYGVALGPPVSDKTAPTAWTGINARVGTLLVGLAPMLGRIEASSAKHLLAGPIRSEAQAQALCGRMAQVGIACSIAPFVGEPLNP